MTARAVRALLEAALDEIGWPFTLTISRLLDELILREEIGG